MAPIVHTVEIDRPPAEVFSFVTDPARFAEWQNDVVKVEAEDGARFDVGTRFTPTRRAGGAERTVVQEITENRPPAAWAARGVDGPIRPSARITVEPLDGGERSRVIFELDFEGHGAGHALVPILRRQAGKAAPVSYRNAKKLLESVPG
jgi:uncharacterized protein YndB with AHSA1/START domain